MLGPELTRKYSRYTGFNSFPAVKVNVWRAAVVSEGDPNIIGLPDSAFSATVSYSQNVLTGLCAAGRRWASIPTLGRESNAIYPIPALRSIGDNGLIRSPTMPS